MKKHPMQDAVAGIVRGDRSAVRAAKEAHCSVDMFRSHVGHRVKWSHIATMLSPDARRELQVLSRELGVSCGAAVEFVVAMDAAIVVENVLLQRRSTRIARREGRRLSVDAGAPANPSLRES